MTNLQQLIERRQGEFIHEYCVKRPAQPIRWIRSIFYDDTDQIEKILQHDRLTATEAYRQALEDVLAGLPEEKKLEAYLGEDPERKLNCGFKIGHNTALQTIRAQIEGLLGKIE